MRQDLTEIIFLLDRSGSMAGLESDTIGGFNAFIEIQKKLPGKTLVTTVLFDDKYELLFNGEEAQKVKLTRGSYFVRGSTALLDAMGKTILDVGRRLSITNKEDRPSKVIFVITTDGMENASREFNYEKVKDLIEHQQKKYGWEFIFLGANIDSAKEALSLGISKENAFNYEATHQGVAKMYCFTSELVSNKRKN